MMLKTIFFNILFLLLMSSCASKNTSSLNDIKHTKETKELRMIMHELDLVMNNDSKSELELDDERRRYALTLADTLEKLSYSIERIPYDELGKSIPKKDMKLFNQYIKQLRKNAQNIYVIAQNYELEKLQAKIEEVKQTCNSCHSYVRNY